MARKPGLFVREVLEDPVDNATKDARWGTTVAMVKTEAKDEPQLVGNELVCTRLANMLGLPVPVGEVGEVEGGQRAWVSAQVGADLPPPDLDLIVETEPHVAAGCAVFDVWIGNHDRNEFNLLHAPSIGLWLIDHEQALAGSAADAVTACERTADTPIRYHAFRGLPLDGAEISWWVQQIRFNLSMSAVHGIVHDARRRRLFTAPVEAAYVQFLQARKHSLPHLVERSLMGDTDTNLGEEELR